MILTPLSGTLLLALALICAGKTPDGAWADVRTATGAVLIGWALCTWSTVFDMTPAQIVMDTTGQYVDPYRIWALQDAIISAWLASVWMVTRKPVTAIVGLIFAAQLFIHALGESGVISDRQPAIDTLFAAQLVFIAAQGAHHSGQRIRDWFAGHSWRSLGAGFRGLSRRAASGVHFGACADHILSTSNRAGI